MPDLSGRWRGGTNSWYDPFGQHTTSPMDRTGHGTQVMGLMVGGDAGGTSVGVAPGARWIAARIYNDAGQGTTSNTHLAFQWLLDPDHNPNTADAPQVVNNSWTYGSGCNLTFAQDIQTLRAAGILPVFAAGNSASLTSSPANNPGAMAVGSTTSSDTIASYSSRGPSACGEPSNTFPELTAPGDNVRTTDLYGGYATFSGTSMAAPHVAGALALLLSAYPNLDCGPAGERSRARCPRSRNRRARQHIRVRQVGRARSLQRPQLAELLLERGAVLGERGGRRDGDLCRLGQPVRRIRG